MRAREVNPLGNSEKVTALKARIAERRKELERKGLIGSAQRERNRFLKWATPELQRVDSNRYSKPTEVPKVKPQIPEDEKTQIIVELTTPQPLTHFEVIIPEDQGEKLVFNLGPTPKQLANIAKAREVKVKRQSETKNQRILNLLERKLTTQEPLSRNDISLIRLAKFETEEIRTKFLGLAKKEENKWSEAAYLVGKNPTAKRYLTGRFKGMLDNGLYCWVYENKDFVLSRGLLNTTLVEPKYSDPRAEITAKNRIEARTEVFILFALWEAWEVNKAKEFDVSKHSNEVAMRSELIQLAQDEINILSEVSFYLGQDQTIVTYQNVRKLVEWAMRNPNHAFSAGLALNPKILMYKDLHKLASWADIKENSDTLLAKNLLKQIDVLMREAFKNKGRRSHHYSGTYSVTEAISFLIDLQKVGV